jgi:hypothetical protein
MSLLFDLFIFDSQKKFGSRPIAAGAVFAISLGAGDAGDRRTVGAAREDREGGAGRSATDVEQ